MFCFHQALNDNFVPWHQTIRLFFSLRLDLLFFLGLTNKLAILILTLFNSEFLKLSFRKNRFSETLLLTFFIKAFVSIIISIGRFPIYIELVFYEIPFFDVSTTRIYCDLSTKSLNRAFRIHLTDVVDPRITIIITLTDMNQMLILLTNLASFAEEVPCWSHSQL